MRRFTLDLKIFFLLWERGGEEPINSPSQEEGGAKILPAEEGRPLRLAARF